MIRWKPWLLSTLCLACSGCVNVGYPTEIGWTASAPEESEVRRLRRDLERERKRELELRRDIVELDAKIAEVKKDLNNR